MKRTSFLNKIIAFLLAISLLQPYEHKFAHLFTHHKDDVCLGIFKKPHLHEINKNCDFYKFKIAVPQTSPPDSQLNVFIPQENQIQIVSHYSFINQHQPLHFSLRAPPYLV